MEWRSENVTQGPPQWDCVSLDVSSRPREQRSASAAHFALLARTFQWADATANFPVVPCLSALWLLSWVLDYSPPSSPLTSFLSLSGPLPSFKVLMDLASLPPIQSSGSFQWGFLSTTESVIFMFSPCQ